MNQILNIVNELPEKYSYKIYTPTRVVIFNGEYDELETPLFVVAYQSQDRNEILLSDKSYMRYRFAEGNTDAFRALLDGRNKEHNYGDYPGLIAKEMTSADDVISMFDYIEDTLTFLRQEGYQLSNRKKMFFDAAFETDEILPYMGNYGLRIAHSEDGSTYKMSMAKYKKTPVPFTEIEYELGSVERTSDGFIYHEGTEEVSEEEYQELHPMLNRIKRSCFDCRDLTTKNLWVFANCMDSLYHLL